MTGAPVLARLGLAFVYLLLTVAAGVPLLAVTLLNVVPLAARPIVAELFNANTFPNGRVLARYSLHIAQLARPSRGALAIITILDL